MSDWAMVWNAVDGRRIALGLSKADLYRASGVSEATFRKMRQGVALSRRDNRSAVCRALQWSSDSIEDILAGREPTPITPLAGDPLVELRERVERLTEAVERLTVLSTKQGAELAQLRVRQHRAAG